MLGYSDPNYIVPTPPAGDSSNRAASTEFVAGATNPINLANATGTLAVANGGTNYTGGAWTTYTPTVTAAIGTFTTVSAAGSYLAIGKLVHFIVTITITTVGTAAGAIIVTLPVGSAVRNIAAAARENAVTGVAGIASIGAAATTMSVVKYDAGTLAASGNQIYVTGFYEAS